MYQLSPYPPGYGGRQSSAHTDRTVYDSQWPKDAASRSYKKWKVFRDEEELRVTNDLPQSIHDALDASEYLIVICSPESMDSLCVPREIAYFLRNHDQEHILTVVTAGDPGQMLLDLLVQLEPAPALAQDDVLQIQYRGAELKLPAAVVTQQYVSHLDEESLFLFCGRRTDRMKALYWCGDGYVLMYKRLSNG